MMLDELLLSLTDRVDAGQRELGGAIEKLVQLLRPDLYELLSCSDGRPFLEPLAFLHFSTGHRASGLEQIFFGYIHSVRPFNIPIASDSDGSFYVPRLGYIATRRPNERLRLIVPPDPD